MGSRSSPPTNAGRVSITASDSSTHARVMPGGSVVRITRLVPGGSAAERGSVPPQPDRAATSPPSTTRIAAARACMALQSLTCGQWTMRGPFPAEAIVPSARGAGRCRHPAPRARSHVERLVDLDGAAGRHDRVAPEAGHRGGGRPAGGDRGRRPEGVATDRPVARETRLVSRGSGQPASASRAARRSINTATSWSTSA